MDTPSRNDSRPVINIDSLEEDEDERRSCCPQDSPERAEPNLPPDLRHPRKKRSPQSEREFYQNQFPAQ